MGIFNKPKLRGNGNKRDSMPDDLWTTCSDCGEMIHALDLKQNLLVCPKCDHHFILVLWPNGKEFLDREITDVFYLFVI